MSILFHHVYYSYLIVMGPVYNSPSSSSQVMTSSMTSSIEDGGEQSWTNHIILRQLQLLQLCFEICQLCRGLRLLVIVEVPTG